MNPEVQKKWVEALRSGKYKQGDSILRNKDNEFCCLGVLCDLHSKEFGYKWKETKLKNFTYQTNVAYLSLDVTNWAGLKEELPTILLNGEKISLIVLNDTEKWTFDQIAKVIEDQV